MLAAPSYDRIGAGFYEIPYGPALYKPAGSERGFRLFGDVDSAILKVTPTRKQRYAKDGQVSYLAVEATTRIDTEFSLKPMQKIDYVRAAALLGEAVLFTQTADPVTVAIGELVVGDLYPLGAYGVTEAEMEYNTATGLKPLPETMFKIVDPGLGVVKLLDLPDDAVAVGGKVVGTLTGTPTAITETDGIKRVDIGTVPQLALEIIIRNLSNQGTHAYLHVFQANLAGDGDVGFISANDDFEATMLKGRAAITGKGIGYHQPLPRK